MKKGLLMATVLLLMASLLAVGNPQQDIRAYEGTTLNVLLKVGYEAIGVKYFVHYFEEATGIDVVYTIVDEPTLRAKFILDAIAEAGDFDVVAVQFWHFPEYHRAGWLVPLTDLDVGFNPFNFCWDAVPLGARGLYTVGDDVYVAPVSLTGAGVLVYRTDVLERWGLTPPRTVRDVMALAMFLREHEPDLHPFVGRGDATAASFGTSAGWAWAYGASVLDPITGAVTVDTPEMYAAMTDLVRLMRYYGPPGQATIGWKMLSELYRAGEVVMTFDMAGFPSVFADPGISEVAGKIGVALITGPEHYAQWLYSEGLGINRFSGNKGAARLFIQWRTSLDTFLREVDAGIRIDFPNLAIYQLDAWWEAVVYHELEFWGKLLPRSLELTDGRYWPFVPEFAPISEAFQEEISLAIAGGQTVAEALRNAQRRIEDILE